jgi:hypothetical protein
MRNRAASITISAFQPDTIPGRCLGFFLRLGGTESANVASVRAKIAGARTLPEVSVVFFKKHPSALFFRPDGRHSWVQLSLNQLSNRFGHVKKNCPDRKVFVHIRPS